MLEELYRIINDRKSNPVTDSYTTNLMNEGEDKILKKIGEEAMEVILAAKGQGNQRLIEEIADLTYHTLVLLSFRNIRFSQIQDELSKRHLEKLKKSNPNRSLPT
jgi:phosphoribosyl-ATP pyrophosphohydrolase